MIIQCTSTQQPFFIPVRFKTQGMNDAAVHREPLLSTDNRFKTQKTCDKAVRNDHIFVRFVTDWSVPDWFVTQQRIKNIRDNINDWCYNKFIEWYDGYKKRKAQKAQTKKDLIPIAWHPSRWWDWFVAKDEKKETEIFF